MAIRFMRKSLRQSTLDATVVAYLINILAAVLRVMLVVAILDFSRRRRGGRGSLERHARHVRHLAAGTRQRAQHPAQRQIVWRHHSELFRPRLPPG